MAQYAVKILLDFDANDDIQAKAYCKSLVDKSVRQMASQIREITVRDMSTHKSIKLSPEGVPQGPWQKA